MGTKILRKLTIATAFGDKIAVLNAALTGRDGGATGTAPEGKPVDILAVVGQVHSIKPGSVKRAMPDGTELVSEYVKLRGTFEATNLVTGEVFPDVGECILPNFVAGPIAAAINAGAKAADFAVKLQARFKITAATSYEFVAESLLPVETSNAVNSIKSRLLALGVEVPKMLTLPAPVVAQGAKTEPAADAAPVDTSKGGKKGSK